MERIKSYHTPRAKINSFFLGTLIFPIPLILRPHYYSGANEGFIAHKQPHLAPGKGQGKSALGGGEIRKYFLDMKAEGMIDYLSPTHVKRGVSHPTHRNCVAMKEKGRHSREACPREGGERESSDFEKE